MTVASQRGRVAPFEVMKVVAAASMRQREHGDVISLAAGQPSSSAPAHVLAAAATALRDNPLGYTDPLGLTDLRGAIAGHYARTYDVEVDPSGVVVTTGASSAVMLAILAGFDSGDRVAVTEPGYPAYRNMLSALGCEVVTLSCDAATGYQPTVATVEALEQPIRGLIVASPANPTGSVISGDVLGELAAWSNDHGVLLVSDEIYHGISFGARLHTAREYSSQAVVINSFSKFWCMTGWRLGWMLAPAGLLPAVDALTSNFSLCPPTLAQYAALQAFTDDTYVELEAHVDTYRTNRDLLIAGLSELGIDRLAPPEGAFYLYADIGHLTDSSRAWCRRLLDDTGVAVVPGVDFDSRQGDKYIRISFGGSRREVEVALDRLARWMKRQSWKPQAAPVLGGSS
ncbi:pyridoxal phosphate-dependent aminotransferase [Mycobacteroides abscessus]|uniref:pyridoxal phosphate-dependent aminotransferase n=1 Tax=Mycobacteroides abscessus TaxID=36809 RepID=UPI001C658F94